MGAGLKAGIEGNAHVMHAIRKKSAGWMHNRSKNVKQSNLLRQFVASHQALVTQEMDKEATAQGVKEEEEEEE